MRSDGASGALWLLDLDQPLACLSETFGRARISKARLMSMRTIVPRKAPALLWREVNLRQGSQWLVNWSLVRGLRYADNSQSVSQQTGSFGWLRRKTGRVCRT